MPSTNKTSLLQLNQWDGTDNPQRVDYNNDNLAIDNFARDSDYQTPIIIGTQIQLQRMGVSKRLFFYLDTDLSGGDITISLDAGATEVNLKDIEDDNITELRKGFVEVVDNTTFFIFRSRGYAKGAKLPMSVVSQLQYELLVEVFPNNPLIYDVVLDDLDNMYVLWRDGDTTRFHYTKYSNTTVIYDKTDLDLTFFGSPQNLVNNGTHAIDLDENNNLYSALSSGCVVSFDSNGNVRWNVQIGTNPFYSGRYYNNAFYIGTANKFYKIDSNSGSVLWDITRNYYCYDFAFDSIYVYVANDDGGISAYAQSNGAVKFEGSFATSNNYANIIYNPTDGFLYASRYTNLSPTRFYAVSAITGVIADTINVNDANGSTGILDLDSEGKIYVYSTSASATWRVGTSSYRVLERYLSSIRNIYDVNISSGNIATIYPNSVRLYKQFREILD